MIETRDSLFIYTIHKHINVHFTGAVIVISAVRPVCMVYATQYKIIDPTGWQNRTESDVQYVWVVGVGWRSSVDSLYNIKLMDDRWNEASPLHVARRRG